MWDWEGIETMPEEGSFLVYMPNERVKIQAAHISKNGVFIIGNHFAFDMTKPTHWMERPNPPEHCLLTVK